jgi:hypothetical protein
MGRAMKAHSLKEAKERVRDESKTAGENGSQVITINGKSIASFKPKRWQDYIGICEGIVSAHMANKKKEVAD